LSLSTKWSGCYALLLFTACGGSKHPALEDLRGHEDLSFFRPGPMSGTRDGDRLDMRAMWTDSSSILTIDLRFMIGSPTTLERGAWRWSRDNSQTNGGVAARSVTFLGGQDGPHSVGGRFDLLGPDGAGQYRVTIPLTELKTRLKADPDWLRAHPAR
jgi:hypothetical protein